MNPPKVSILIPLYNSENYIEETIQSCLNQTYENIEIIIVDDGSTDKSLQIAKSFESGKLKVYSQPNSGACKARNLAFEKSIGDYIQYLDADDLLSENKIENQIKDLKNTDYKTIAFCSHTRDLGEFNKGIYKTQIIEHSYEKPLNLLLDIFNGKGNVLVHCWLCSRRLIEETGSWHEEIHKAQDSDFFVRLILKCNRVLFSYETLVFYRILTNSVSTTLNVKSLESVLMVNSIIEKLVLEKENSSQTKNAIIHLHSMHFCSNYNIENAGLLNPVELRIKELGGKITFVGNMYFKLLSKFIGVKNALQLKNYLKNI